MFLDQHKCLQEHHLLCRHLKSCAFGYWNVWTIVSQSVIDLPQGLSGAAELGLSFIQITANLTCQSTSPLSTETTFGLKSIPKQWWKERMGRGREQQTRKPDSAAWHLPVLCSVNNQAKPGSDTPNREFLLNTTEKSHRFNIATSHTNTFQTHTAVLTFCSRHDTETLMSVQLFRDIKQLSLRL